jgi:cytochrome c oxidase assembly protein subunit 15
MVRLHRLAVLLCAFAFVLLLVGALVTSTGSGLSITGWPGLAADQSAPGVLLQQTHRLLAAVVVLLSLAVVFAAWRHDPRPWMKGLSVAAAALLIAQAIYGGMAVILLLPAYFSIFHAAFAQLFFALTVAMALFTSPGWFEGRVRDGAGSLADDRPLRLLELASTLAIYAQVLLGAGMRHSYAPGGLPAGLSIPDYPLAFGRLLPLDQISSAAVTLAFAHRLVALAAAALVTITVLRVYRRHRSRASLARPASVLALLVVTQVILGGLTVLSGMTPMVSASHAAAAAVALAAGVVLLLRSSRPMLEPAAAAAETRG